MPGEDEKNTHSVDITEDMTAQDVMNKILEILEYTYCSKSKPIGKQARPQQRQNCIYCNVV